MKEFLTNNIIPIITAGIAGTIVKLIYPIGGAAVQLILKKKDQVEQVIKTSGHEADVNAGWEIWRQIDEKWRITNNIETFLISKGDEFLSLMKKKCPGLTDDEIISIRQAIAGEVNKSKSAVLSQSDVIKQLQDSNTSLQNENASIKDQLNKVQSVVTVATNNTQVTDNSQADPTPTVGENTVNTLNVTA